jgi:ATP-binding cassette subfamily C protein CydC
VLKLLRLLGESWRTQWPWLGLGIGLMLLSSAAALLLLGLSGWLITASALAGLGLFGAVDIFTPGGGIRLAAITRTVSRYGERLATHRATLGLLAALRVKLMSRLLELDEIQLRRLRRGDTLNRLTRDVESLEHLFAGVVGPIVGAALTTLAVAAALHLLATPSAALATVGLGIGGVAVTALIGIVGKAPTRALALAEPALRHHCAGALEGLKSLLAEDRVEDHHRHLATLSAVRIGYQRRLERLDAAGRAVVEAFGYAAAWIVLLVSLQGHQSGIPGPAAVMALLLVLGMNEIWQVLPSAWRQLTHTRLAGQRVTELAETQPLLDRAGTIPPPPGPNRIQLEGVRFGWPGTERPLFARLDLEVGAGRRLLISGPSGCGKTTLACLLMRQIDPDGGIVRLDDVDLRQIEPDALRRHIGYLPQHPVIFADTLAANLRVAQPAADDAAIESALRDAGLGDWLDALEDGLDTWLDEGGASISGGERRRIALARLMLVDPPVVILDEPTTGLDPATARRLSAGLDDWLRDRTTIMISHEPEWLPRYDDLARL